MSETLGISELPALSRYVFGQTCPKSRSFGFQSKSWQMPWKLQSALISIWWCWKQRALMAKESAMVQIETKITCGLRFNSLNGHCWFPVTPFVHRCNQRNPPILPCPGKAKLGEDHPDTLNSINNLAAVLDDQEAEPLYREALEKSPGAQLQRFQRDFGQWIWSHTLLDFRWVIRFLMTGICAAILLGCL